MMRLLNSTLLLGGLRGAFDSCVRLSFFLLCDGVGNRSGSPGPETHEWRSSPKRQQFHQSERRKRASMHAEQSSLSVAIDQTNGGICAPLLAFLWGRLGAGREAFSRCVAFFAPTDRPRA
jgi:hypothetical protein